MESLILVLVFWFFFAVGYLAGGCAIVCIRTCLGEFEGFRDVYTGVIVTDFLFSVCFIFNLVGRICGMGFM